MKVQAFRGLRARPPAQTPSAPSRAKRRLVSPAPAPALLPIVVNSRFEPNLRTAIVQAFARTLLDAPSQQAIAAGSAPAPRCRRLPGPRLAEGGRPGGHPAYRLTKLLGQGMFGKVYVAQRDVPEHRVALKLLPPRPLCRPQRRARLVMLATVGHPHVVQLKDHGTTAEYVWLTMPVYQGETLAERLAQLPLASVKPTTSSSPSPAASKRCTPLACATRT